MKRIGTFRLFSQILAALAITLGFGLSTPAWGQTADLSINKDDGSPTSVPGTGIVYTIQVMNAGPDADPAAVVTDMFPAALQGVTWTCVASVGSSCTPAGGGNIADVVNLLAGGVVTYTVSATIDPSATGMVSNTATVTPSVFDPNGLDNLWIDTNTLTPEADLAISKTDGSATAVPGTPISYTIVVSNAGPSDAPGTSVSDTFPGSLNGVSWSCSATPGSSCTPGGVGNIADVITLLAGGSATYTVNATISPAATGILSNTATVTAPGGVTDTVPSNNSAPDNSTLTPQADLAVSKTDGVVSVTAGNPLVYTIVVTNSGPSDAPNATVTDNFPASLTGVTWTCAPGGGASCTAGGVGNINEIVSLPSGGSVTYTVNATVDACAGGSVSNTVTVAPGIGVSDPGPGMNSATDVDTVSSSADLSLSVVDSPDSVLVCNSLSYSLTITNNGPSCATGVMLENILPPGVSFSSSVPGNPTCVDNLGTQTCSLGTLLPGGMTAVSIVGIVDFSLKGSIVLDTATVSSSTVDPNPVNDTFIGVTDVKPKDPYVVTLTGSPRFLRIGVVTKVDYLLRVTSLCLPSLTASNVVITSELPPGLEFVQSIPAPTSQVDNTLTFEYPVFAGDTIEQVVMQAQLVDGTPAGTQLTHTVSLIDDLTQAGSDSFTIGVRALGAGAGKLKLRLSAPRRIQAGALLKTRIGIDHTAIEAATNVELSLSTPEEAELVSAVPPPTSIEMVGGELLLGWSFPQIPRKQIIRLTQRVRGEVDQGAVLTLDGSVSDDADRSATASRDVVIRGQVRPTPTPRP